MYTQDIRIYKRIDESSIYPCTGPPGPICDNVYVIYTGYTSLIFTVESGFIG